MGIFISAAMTAECVLTAVVFAALLAACCCKPLGILQSCGYCGKRFWRWVKKKGNMAFTRHVLLAFLCVLSSAVVSLCFAFAGQWAAVIGLVCYAVFFVLYVVADKKIALRSPVVFTPRLKRLYLVLFFITAVFVYLAVTLLNFADYVWGDGVFHLMRYCALAVFPLLIFPLVLLANALARLYETPHNKKFVRAAQRKLAAAPVKVVAVTGSYGKTGTKHVLAAMLSKKYRVLMTPQSYNTPLGVALTVNGADLNGYDILIAEMGARRTGDIAELCELCPPDYAVITGICPQHLESFGSMENLVKAKGEILAYVKEQAVIADSCYHLFEAYPCPKQRQSCLSDVICTCNGTSFTLTLGGVQRRVTTRLLGRHAAENIALAAQTAYLLGVTAEDIAQAAEALDFVEHRLQLIRSGGVNILDDGYNSNIQGAAAALEVLKSFGGRKIVVTPGLVELGILEESGNRQLGAGLVGLDLVLLVGDTLITPVREGYRQNGGDMQKLRTVPTLAAAQEALKGYLQDGDTVLFLNDLPDIY